jgi:hypothetical protein
VQEDGQGVTGENAAAVVLAGRGFVVMQNPLPAQVAAARDRHGDAGEPDKNPDYLVEGRVFDCYTPRAGTPPRNVWSTTDKKKIRKGQTQRVVLSLRDWGGDLDALRVQFADWPVPGLKELVVVTGDGRVLHWIP